MGYSARTVSAKSVVKSIWESVPIYICRAYNDGTVNYIDLLKQTIDFTDIAYLNVTWDNNVGPVLKLSIGGVTKFEATGNDWQHYEIDCTGITGDQILLLEIKDDTPAVNAIDNLTIFARGA